MSNGHRSKWVLPGLSLLLALGLVACAVPQSGAPASPAAPTTPAAPAASAPAPAPAFDAAKHFAGKTITLTVSNNAGSTTDLGARVLAPFLTKALPGNPTIVVENRPGGGGVTGLNYFYQTAKTDGLAIVYQGAPAFKELFVESSKAEFEVMKMHTIGGLGEASVLYASTANGIKTPKDLYQREQLTYGALRGVASSNTTWILSQLDLLGANMQGVVYPGGGGESRAAVIRGEADVFNEGVLGFMKTIMPEVERGNIVPLWQTGLLYEGKVIRDQRVADLPTFVEVYEELTGSPLTGEDLAFQEIMAADRTAQFVFMLPPGTPPEIVEVWEKALWSAMNSPEFLKTTEVNGEPMMLADAKLATDAQRRIVELRPEQKQAHYDRWKTWGLQ